MKSKKTHDSYFFCFCLSGVLSAHGENILLRDKLSAQTVLQVSLQLRRVNQHVRHAKGDNPNLGVVNRLVNSAP